MAGSLALGGQMCLPQGQQQKKVQTKVCLLTIKEPAVRGPWREGSGGGGCSARGPYWGPTEAIVPCLRGQRRGQSQRSRVWELLGHLSCVLQPAPKQLLAAPERGWARRRWGPFPPQRAGLKGPRPGGSRMTGQGLTEASMGRRGRRGPLQQALRLFGRPWWPPQALEPNPLCGLL